MSDDNINWEEPETVIDAKAFHERARRDAEKEYTEEEAKIIKERLGELNEKFMEGELVSPDKIYLDLAILKDYHLGTLFAMISRRDTSQKDYEYIRSNLKEYQIRLYDDPLKYFPELNISQEEFDAFRDNEKHHNEIYVLSPYTSFKYVLRDNLKRAAQHAHMKQKYTDTPIDGTQYFYRKFDEVTYFINTWPLKLTDRHRRSLQAIVGENLGVNVCVFSQDVKDIPVNFFLRMDEINTFWPNRFMENKGMREELGKEKFVGKHIFMPLMFDKEKEEVMDDPEVFAREKKTFHALMCLCCHFHWLEAARYCSDSSVFDNPNNTKSDEEIREAELPAL